MNLVFMRISGESKNPPVFFVLCNVERKPEDFIFTEKMFRL